MGVPPAILKIFVVVIAPPLADCQNCVDSTHSGDKMRWLIGGDGDALPNAMMTVMAWAWGTAATTEKQ